MDTVLYFIIDIWETSAQVALRVDVWTRTSPCNQSKGQSKIPNKRFRPTSTPLSALPILQRPIQRPYLHVNSKASQSSHLTAVAM